MKKASEFIKKRRISPDDGYHYFFGYYDLQAYSADMKKHLCNRVPFMDRFPGKDDIAELGYIDLDTLKFVKLAETTAWNFQQGCMLQWNPLCEDEIIYNVRVTDSDNELPFRTCIQNIVTGKKRYCDRAVANVSPDGKYGLSINFARVYDFRPGYGYGGFKDPNFDIPQPDNDGVWLIDMLTGKSRLIIDYARITREFGNEKYLDSKFVVNHITFNTESNRFLFLNRNFPNTGKGWATTLFTSDLEGNLCLLLDSTMVSHYHWKNGSQILAYCNGDPNDRPGVYLIDDFTAKSFRYGEECFERGDIHTIYSPDRRFIMGDGYPDKEQHRSLYVYDSTDGSWDIFVRVYSDKPEFVDNRCDLHALWSPDGRRVSYDSTETKRREIYELDVSYIYD